MSLVEKITVDDLPLIAPDSPPGVYRGPRGGLIEVLDNPFRERRNVHKPPGWENGPPVRVAGKYIYPPGDPRAGSERNQQQHARPSAGVPAGLAAPATAKPVEASPAAGHSAGSDEPVAAAASPPGSAERGSPGSKRSHINALREWAAIYRRRDQLVRWAAAAGVGVNEITRITGLAKTTVIRIIKR